MRSGIGSKDELEALNIPVIKDLPGVGKNLHDHPALGVLYSGSPNLVKEMNSFAKEGGLMREEGTTGLAQSHLNQPDSPFDLHIYPTATRPQPPLQPDYIFQIATAVMTPHSRGSIKLSSKDPNAKPIIDTAFFSDSNGHDLEVLMDGIEICRKLGLTIDKENKNILGQEIYPGEQYQDRKSLADFILKNSRHDYHPCCTSKMAPSLEMDKYGVVNENGQVFGVEGITIIDLSVAPQVPRANTNIPALVIGLRIIDLYLKNMHTMSF